MDIYYIVPYKTLASIAEVIREKSGSNKKLSFPQDFITSIKHIISSISEYEFFDGEYEIIPKVETQILETEGKIMEENLMIKEIPYYEVSNSSGYTVYIGGDLNA